MERKDKRPDPLLIVRVECGLCGKRVIAKLVLAHLQLIHGWRVEIESEHYEGSKP